MPTEILTAASGTWTCPARVASISLVEVWGDGGNGGNANGGGAGGGGGGGYASQPDVPVTPTTGYAYQIGQGASGNDTWFINSSTVKATGGSPGSNGPSGS